MCNALKQQVIKNIVFNTPEDIAKDSSKTHVWVPTISIKTLGVYI